MRFLGRLVSLFLLVVLVLAGLSTAAAVIFIVLAAALPDLGRGVGLYGHRAFMGHAWMPGVWLAVAPLILLGVLFFIGLLIWKLLTSIGSGKHEEGIEEESRLMQELHHGLFRLEERVEALETILIEFAATKASHGSQTDKAADPKR